MLCTARSISSRNRASSISFTKRPLPPMAAKGTSRILSPEVLMVRRVTDRSGATACRLAWTHSACQRASLLPRVPITSDERLVVVRAIMSACVPALPSRLTGPVRDRDLGMELATSLPESGLQAVSQVPRSGMLPAGAVRRPSCLGNMRPRAGSSAVP
jgi:hypothetical protein